jgi:hypothetical protein
MSFCEKCGLQAEDGDIHCTGCGQKLRSSNASVNAPVAVAAVPPVEPSPPPAVSQPRQRDAQDPTATRDGTLRELRGRSGFRTRTTEDEVVVDIVFPRTPADLAGMERGDVIMRVGQTSVASLNDFAAAIQEIDLGQLFTLEVVRGQKSEILRIEPKVRPPVVTPPVTNNIRTASPTLRQNKLRAFNGSATMGCLVVGSILLVAGIYFGTYSSQNFACNLASAVGVNQPVSCAWYQIAYTVRDWCIGFGALFLLAILIDFIVALQSRK